MTIWEKVVVNLEKGAQKMTAGAAVFSERVKAEIAIMRLRIRRDEVRSILREQYEIIGRKLVELNQKEALPKTTELLLREEEIVTALAEIAAREKDLEEIRNQIANERAAFTIQEKSRDGEPAS